MMTHECYKPLKAVLDYFNQDDVTLIGISLGRCLALRAAAHESRVRRIVADDVLSDFPECLMYLVAPEVHDKLTHLLEAGSDDVVDAALEQAMHNSPVVPTPVRGRRMNLQRAAGPHSAQSAEAWGLASGPPRSQDGSS